MAKISRSGWWQGICPLVVAAITGCGADVAGPTEPEVAQEQAPIINGDIQAPAAAEGSGLVQVLKTGGSCSGTLLRNDIVLTANHCLGSGMSIRMGSITRPVAETTSHPTLDVAVLWLQSFANVGGASRFDWTRSIYSGTNASLNGTLMLCYGYGSRTDNPCPNGSGGGDLQFGNIRVAATNATTLTYERHALFNQVQFRGDSGGSCLLNEQVTGVLVSGSCPVTQAFAVGQQAYRPWAISMLDSRPHAAMHTATAASMGPNYTIITDSTLNNKPNALIHATANWNGYGTTGVYNNANTGVWYNGSKWTVFNQNGAAIPTNAKFNYWRAADGGRLHVATNPAGGCSSLSPSCNVPSWLPHVSQLDLGNAADNGNRFLMLQVTQIFGASGVYNNRAVGVWFDTGTSRWYVYNEDGQPVPNGASFVVSVVRNTNWGSFTHTSTAGSVVANSTTLNNVNLNGQPNAQILVTHNFSAGGGNNGSFHNQPIGVWYDTSVSRWKIFNQNTSVAMPTNVNFNIMVRP